MMIKGKCMSVYCYDICLILFVHEDIIMYKISFATSVYNNFSFAIHSSIKVFPLTSKQFSFPIKCLHFNFKRITILINVFTSTSKEKNSVLLLNNTLYFSFCAHTHTNARTHAHTHTHTHTQSKAISTTTAKQND